MSKNRVNRSRLPDMKPPTRSATIQHNHVFRFRASNLASTSITKRDIFNILVCALSSTQAVSLLDSFKVNLVEMWGISSTGSTQLTCEFLGQGTSAGRSHRKECVSMGNAMPAHLQFSPSRESLASKWQTFDSLSTVFMELSFPTQALVDLHLSYTLRDNTVTPTIITVAGATAGVVYQRALDSSSTNLLVPVSYPSI